MLTKVRKIISTASLLLVVSLGLFSYDLLNFIRSPLVPERSAPVDYIFEPGSSIFTLSADLKQIGLVQRQYYLVILAKWCHLAHQLKAGEYRFLPGTKPLQLLEQIAQGRVLSHQLTVIEGWTFAKMMDVIRTDSRLKKTLTNVAPEIIMVKLGAPNTSPEGLFFPDTYRYTRGTSDFAILQTAYQAMNKRLAQEWQNRAADLPYKTPYEALIVASLIEKETAKDSERPLIAGVIINRLKKNMLLQIDPTVIYGIGNNYHLKLRSADLKMDTPFNTYLHQGLPPTPIALPSMASLHWALHPMVSNHLYFMAKGDGSHYFSTSLNEHHQAVQRYLQFKHQSVVKAENKSTAASKVIIDQNVLWSGITQPSVMREDSYFKKKD